MKRKGNLLIPYCEDLYNIYIAIFGAMRGKKHKKEIIQFTQQYTIEVAAKIVQNLLLTEQWTPSPYRQAIINDKGKERTLMIAPFFPDRIVHHVVNNILNEVFVPSFIQDTYQCIRGRGPKKAITKTEGYVQNRYSEYVLKVDISKYYPSVNNEILKQKIVKKIKDKHFLKLVDSIIDSAIGLPLGNVTSQILGNIYLNDLDNQMKQKNSSYIRYADDIIIFGSKVKCKQYILDICEYLKNHKLRLNPSSQYFPLDRRPLTFLGFNFFRTHTRPKKKILLKIEKNRRLNKFNQNQKASMFGWLKISDSVLISICKLYQEQLEVNPKSHEHFKQFKAFYKYLYFKHNKEKSKNESFSS